jgi:hypothetical protein
MPVDFFGQTGLVFILNDLITLLSRSAVIWKMVPLCILWCLWSKRNERCFEDSERSLEDLTAFFFHTFHLDSSLACSFSD